MLDFLLFFTHIRSFYALYTLRCSAELCVAIRCAIVDAVRDFEQAICWIIAKQTAYARHINI